MSETVTQSSSSSNQYRRFFTVLSQRAVSAITLRRVGLSIAGTFAFAGAVAALNANSPAENPSAQPTSHTAAQANQSSTATNDSNDSTPAADSHSSSSTSFSSTTTNGVTNTHLNVNGQDIPVPANGSTQQTVTNGTTQTTINASTSTTGQGAASNTNSTNFSVNITNNSSASGGSSSQ